MDLDHSSLLAAVKRYEDLLDKDPRSCCFAPLSELYCKLGQYDEAMTIAQRGIELHPDYAGGYLAMGKVYLGKGMKAEGSAVLEHALQLTPDNHIALKTLGQLYLDAGRDEDALVVLRRVLELNPMDDECKAALDSLVQATGQPAGDPFEIVPEIGLLRDSVDDDDYFTDSVPGSIDVEEDAVFYDDSDLLARESGSADRVGDPLVTPTLAEMYLTQGFAEKALDIYRQLLREDPGNSEYRLRSDQISEVVDAGRQGAVQESYLQHDRAVGESQATTTADEVAVTDESVVKALEVLLSKIERRRACLSGTY